MILAPIVAGSALLGAGIVVVFVLRLAALWYLPTHDFDTGSLISILHGGFRRWKTVTDIAHPGGLEVVMGGLSLLVRYTGGPATLWFCVSSAALGLSTALIFWTARSLSDSGRAAATLTLAYLASPILSDLAARGEENLLFHGLFTVAIFSLHRYSTTSSIALLAVLAVLGLAIASLHFQPFLVVTVGVACHVARRGDDNPSGHKRAVIAGAFFAGAGLAYLLTLRVLTRLALPNYMGLYFSLLHNDSFLRYLQSFLLFAQGYLVTGHMPHVLTASQPAGVEPTSSLWWLGFPALLIVTTMVYRQRLVDWITLSALGFAFAYEPNSSERWDTLLISVLLGLALTRGTEERWGKFSTACVGVLLVGGLYGLQADFHSIVAAHDRRQELRSVLGNSSDVFLTPTAAVALSTAVPHGIHLRNLDRVAKLEPGTVVFLTTEATARISGMCEGRLRPLGLGFYACD